MEGSMTGSQMSKLGLDVHEVRCSAAKIAYTEEQGFYAEHDGDYIIPIHIKIGQGTIIRFQKLYEVTHSSISRKLSIST